MSIAQVSTLHCFVCNASDKVQYLLMIKIALGENLDFVTLTTLSLAQSQICLHLDFSWVPYKIYANKL